MGTNVLFLCIDCFSAVPVDPQHYGHFSKTRSGLFDLAVPLTCPKCDRKLIKGGLYQLVVSIEKKKKSKIEIGGSISGTSVFIGDDNVGQIQTDDEGKYIFFGNYKYRLSDECLKDTSS